MLNSDNHTYVLQETIDISSKNSLAVKRASVKLLNTEQPKELGLEWR